MIMFSVVANDMAWLKSIMLFQKLKQCLGDQGNSG